MTDFADYTTGDPTEPMPVKAARMLQDANKALATKNYEVATQLYSVVSQLYYGRALLNNAIERSGILGDAEQVKNATGKREKDLLSAVDESVTAAIAPAKSASNFVFIGDSDGESDEEEAAADADAATENKDSGASAAANAEHSELDALAFASYAEEEDDEENQDEEDGDGEIDDFQIAFEVLDVARIIYRQMLDGQLPLELDEPSAADDDASAPAAADDGKGKAKQTDDGDRADKLVKVQYKLAEVCATLGDVSLESESFEQAIEDYNIALTMKTDLLEPSNRQLAELHYKLALSIEYANQGLDRVVEHMRQARDIMVARRTVLEKRMAPAAAADDQSAPKIVNTAPMEAEIAEINELLPDLDIKLEDLTAQKEGRHTLLDDDSAAINQARAHLASAAVVNDLSSLIKKKKPATETSATPVAATTTTTTKQVEQQPPSPSPKKRKAAEAVPSTVDETATEKKAKVDE
ncbi:hypothetical protein RI367_000536 [Sorochytrium milnesiophthora]